MPASGKFSAAALAADWRGYGSLARLLEERELTNRQAQAVLLYTRGLGYAEIGRVLGADRQNAYDALRTGVRRLIRHRPELRDRRRRWIRALLDCFKNRRGGGKQPPRIEDENGRVVTVRAPVVTPDDFLTWRYYADGESELVHPDLDLFVTLLEELARPARQQEREEDQETGFAGG